MSKYKIIANKNEVVIPELLSEKLELLRNGKNIFVLEDAEQTYDLLLDLKAVNVSINELLAVNEKLIFLLDMTEPVVREEQPETQIRKSIYICLKNLRQDNKTQILGHLARDMGKLGFRSPAEEPLPAAYLTKELMNAIVNEDYSEVYYILSKHPDLNYRLAEYDENTPLIYAILKENSELVRDMIAMGAEVNLPNIAKATPLMAAAKCGNPGIVNLLLESGAISAINSQDESGMTALMYAAEKGQIRIIKILKNCGANVTMTNNAGFDAQSFAFFSGKFIASWLLRSNKKNEI
ncbi:MAG: ankyrin repeat domain-containing protein [Candidatus Margulisbacteria bacterium]|nr:ankyrin repeat domain-containing protein [Candidatus Margulisiibacteriota bacterium]